MFVWIFSSAQRWLTTAPGAATTHWYQIRCVLSQPLYVMAGQEITGHLIMVAHSAQSYTLHLTMSGKWNKNISENLFRRLRSINNRVLKKHFPVKVWGASGQAVVQSSSEKLDLKEPYYRMSQPQAYAWTQEQMNQMHQQLVFFRTFH
jgi:histone-arginine methyltransferase CARM1